MKIIRVFPTKTNMTPTDEYSFVGQPTFFIPEHDEVHISVTFTWDLKHAEYLKRYWESVTDKPVLIGGPAFGDRGGEFEVGKYLKAGVTTTSRGCPNNCSFCFVPKREGKIRELEIKEGNIVQDNNLLACSDRHKADVFKMLSKQKAIIFSGGFEARRVTDDLILQLLELSLKELWLACDTPQSYKLVSEKIELLRSYGISQHKIRCYVIIGKDKKEELNRLTNLLHSGCLPFAQLYRTADNKEYSRDWKDFQRYWSRPAIYRATVNQ